MTWKEFKLSLEAQGVQDDWKLDYIDFQPDCDGIPPTVTAYIRFGSIIMEFRVDAD